MKRSARELGPNTAAQKLPKTLSGAGPLPVAPGHAAVLGGFSAAAQTPSDVRWKGGMSDHSTSDGVSAAVELAMSFGCKCPCHGGRS